MSIPANMRAGHPSSSSSIWLSITLSWVQFKFCFLKLKKKGFCLLVFKSEEDPDRYLPHHGSVRKPIAFRDLLPISKYHQQPLSSSFNCLVAGLFTISQFTIPRSNFIQGSSGKIRFFVSCALNICQISTNLAMSNGPSQFVRKNSHSITMEIFYVPSLSRLLVFSPSSLGPGWAGFLGNFGPH